MTDDSDFSPRSSPRLGDIIPQIDPQIYFLTAGVNFVRNLSVRPALRVHRQPFVSRCKFNLTLNWSHYFATLYPPTRQRMEFDLRYGRTTSPLFQSSSFFLSICSLSLSLSIYPSNRPLSSRISRISALFPLRSGEQTY